MNVEDVETRVIRASQISEGMVINGRIVCGTRFDASTDVIHIEMAGRGRDHTVHLTQFVIAILPPGGDQGERTRLILDWPIPALPGAESDYKKRKRAKENGTYVPNHVRKARAAAWDWTDEQIYAAMKSSRQRFEDLAPSD